MLSFVVLDLCRNVYEVYFCFAFERRAVKVDITGMCGQLQSMKSSKECGKVNE